MSTEVILFDDDRSSDGPKMAALSDQQRRFVMIVLSTAPRPGQEAAAALMAGYAHEQSGYNLMRNPRILDAVHEESAKKVLAAAQLGISIMLEIAGTPGHKDQYKAAKDLAAMSGFSPVAKQEIKVEHSNATDQERVKRIIENAQRLGLDPVALLGRAGVIVDAEFTVVEEAKDFSEVEW